MRPRSLVWWAAALLAAAVGVTAARHFYRPDSITVPPPEDTGAPLPAPVPAPPALG